MNIINRLEKLHAEASPGAWINNSHYECVHTYFEPIKLRPVVHYSTNNPQAEADAALIVAMHAALPKLIAIAKAAERVAAAFKDAERFEVINDMRLTLIEELQATLTKDPSQ